MLSILHVAYGISVASWQKFSIAVEELEENSCPATFFHIFLRIVYRVILHVGVRPYVQARLLHPAVWDDVDVKCVVTQITSVVHR